MSKDTNRMAWLEERRSGIGGTDVAAILGLSEWKSPMQVWLEKTGQAELSDEAPSDPAYWGRMLEPIVAQEYKQRHPEYQVWQAQKAPITRHQEFPVLIATPDRIVGPAGNNVFLTGGAINWPRVDRILEVKTANAFSREDWGTPGTEEVPQAYLLQCLHYLNVTGLQEIDLAVLFGGNQYCEYRIGYDEDICEWLKGQMLNWWNTQVIGKIAPEALSVDDLAARFPYNRGGFKPISEKLGEALRHYVTASEATKECETDMRHSKFVLCNAVAEADGLCNEEGKPLVTWKTNCNGTRCFRITREALERVGEEIAGDREHYSYPHARVCEEVSA